MRHLLLSVLLACLLPQFSIAGMSFYYKQISLKEGLSQSTVKSLCLDHKGYLWIGTNHGLNRYDGNDMVQYFTNTDGEKSLSSNSINFVFEDRDHTLWIGTESSIMQYDRVHNSFVDIELTYNNLAYRDYVVHQDGGITFVRHDRLLQWDPQTRTYMERRLSAPKGESLSASLKAVLLNDNELLIAYRWLGLYICNLQNGTLKRCSFFTHDNIFDVYVDAQGNIWSSIYAKGVECWSPASKKLTRYNTFNGMLNNNVVHDIFSFAPHEIWIATDGGGINIIDTRDGSVRHIVNNPEDNYSIPVNSLNLFYKDPKGNIWIGSLRGGALGMKPNFIRFYTNSYPTSAYGLSQMSVNMLYQDPQDNIWIATDGEGVNRFDAKRNQFTHFPPTFGKKIVSIAQWDKQSLLISCFREGLFLMDKKSGKLSPSQISIDPVRKNNMGLTGLNLYRTSPDKMLIYTDSIYLYDCKKEQFEPLPYCGVSLKKGVLFLANQIGDRVYFHNQEQLLAYNRVTNEVSLDEVYQLPTEIKSTSIFVTEDSVAWIGSEKGLYRYQLSTKEIVKVASFPNVMIANIYCDYSNNLWIGAQGLLYRYMAAQKRYLVYGETDGVVSNEYLPKAKLLTADSILLMGGVAGLVRVTTGVSPRLSSHYQPVISDVLVDGSPLNEASFRELTKQQKVSLSATHTTFAVRVLLEGGDLFSNMGYRYRLKGYNDKFITTTQSMIIFNDLQPGYYELQIVSAQEGDGLAERLISLNIRVLPHWWQAWWFYLLCVLAIVMLILLYVRIFNQRHRRQLQEQIFEMERANYEQKVRFLININHELRTPLTLITLPLGRLLDDSATIERGLKEILTRIHRQALQMKSIIDIILDIRKIEVTQEKVSLSEHNLNEWIAEQAACFSSEFAAANIQLLVAPYPEPILVSFDTSKCNKVISNILMNALKFSKAQTTVKVTILLRDEYVRIEVSDQGVGIEPADIDKLFSRFYQAAHDKGGSGIGLSYSKILVEMHGGNMGACNNPTEGATVYFELPLAAPSGSTQTGGHLLVEGLSQPESIAATVDIGSVNRLNLGDYQLLLVEDERELLQMMKEQCSPYFKTVFTATNGVEALQVLSSQVIDFVVSDVMMSHKNGFELCRDIKSNTNTSHIPIILLSARSNHASSLIGFKAGADGYVTKPFEMDILLQQINNVLQSRALLYQRLCQRGILVITESADSITDSDKMFLTKLHTHLVSSIANPKLDVDIIADMMGMSRSSLYAKVKALLHVGIKEYIIQQRINTAKTLLSETQLSISEICDRIGYEQPRHFSTIFKQTTGVTPSAYREGQRPTC